MISKIGLVITMSEQNTLAGNFFIECKEKEQEKLLDDLISHCEDFILEDE